MSDTETHDTIINYRKRLRYNLRKTRWLQRTAVILFIIIACLFMAAKF